MASKRRPASVHRDDGLSATDRANAGESDGDHTSVADMLQKIGEIGPYLYQSQVQHVTDPGPYVGLDIRQIQAITNIVAESPVVNVCLTTLRRETRAVLEGRPYSVNLFMDIYTQLQLFNLVVLRWREDDTFTMVPLHHVQLELRYDTRTDEYMYRIKYRAALAHHLSTYNQWDPRLYVVVAAHPHMQYFPDLCIARVHTPVSQLVHDHCTMALMQGLAVHSRARNAMLPLVVCTDDYNRRYAGGADNTFMSSAINAMPPGYPDAAAVASETVETAASTFAVQQELASLYQASAHAAGAYAMRGYNDTLGDVFTGRHASLMGQEACSETLAAQYLNDAMKMQMRVPYVTIGTKDIAPAPIVPDTKDYLEFGVALERRVCMAFGLDPSMIDTANGPPAFQTDNSRVPHYVLHARRNLLPLVDLLGALSRTILASYAVTVSKLELEATQAIEPAQLLALFTSGVATQQEVRDRMGLVGPGPDTLPLISRDTTPAAKKKK
jgi:hypothetical protein